MADDFRTEMKVGAPVWVDTKRVTYKHLEFTYGKAKVLGPRSLVNAVRAMFKGHRQHRTQGNAMQNGGVLIAKKGGACAYAFSSEVAGDKPRIDEVLAAARNARVGT